MANDDPFSSPSETGPKITDMGMGTLLLIKPTEYKTGIKTPFGDDKDLVLAEVTVLDGENAGAVHGEVAIFQGGLIGQTKNKVGKMVLGRLEQDPPKQKGHNPMWTLRDGSEADKELARKHLAGLDQFA